jgi:hypothetical protein
MNLNKGFTAAIPILGGVRLASADDQAVDSRSVAQYNLKRFEEAEKYFGESLGINPKSHRHQQHLNERTAYADQKCADDCTGHGEHPA